MQDCNNIHLDTMEAHTASLQEVTGGTRTARLARRMVVRRRGLEAMTVEISTLRASQLLVAGLG